MTKKTYYAVNRISHDGVDVMPGGVIEMEGVARFRCCKAEMSSMAPLTKRAPRPRRRRLQQQKQQPKPPLMPLQNSQRLKQKPKLPRKRLRMPPQKRLRMPPQKQPMTL
jgi:hypothetical protein